MPKPLDPSECAALVESNRWQNKVGLDDSGCVVWMATRTHAGYGAVRLSNGMARAHRVAWVAAEGKDVPDGLTIDHLCRNRACVNPEHLEAVTQQENTLRGETLPAAQVRRTHCPQGHALTDDNLAPWRLPKRICLTCLRERDRARYAVKRVRGRAEGPTPAVHGDWMAGYESAMRDILRALDGEAMSVCCCGQVEIPLGMTMLNDPRSRVLHGVTACVSAGTDWERRAKDAEAAIARVRDILEPYVPCPDHDEDCDSVICRLRLALAIPLDGGAE